MVDTATVLTGVTAGIRPAVMARRVAVARPRTRAMIEQRLAMQR